MKLTLTSVLCALVCGIAAGAMAQPYENSSVVGQVPDRVVITLKAGYELDLSADKAAGTGLATVDGLLARFDATGIERLHAPATTAKVAARIAASPHRDKATPVDVSWLDRVYAVDFPAQMGLRAVQAAFASLPEVAEVRAVDICKQYAFMPDDPSLVSNQWYLRNTNVGGGDVRAIGAWNQTLGDTNVIIAIIDSGVDWNHPDLGGSHPDKVNGAVWTNWAEYNGLPGVDDDSNGFLDDIRGWDFVNAPGQGWPGQDETIPDNDPSDYESHGTACAGAAAAITNNGIGIAGTAPGCKIMALRAGYRDASGQGVVRMDFVASAMIYAAGNGASIINGSWGSSSYLSGAVNIAHNADILIVTAAGNDDTDSDPGAGVPSYLSTYSGVISVAATDGNDAKTSFSNYGTWVEVSAPGTGIYTTWYNATTDEHTYASVQGTSFSSPITAGAAALLRSANPGMNRGQIRTLLMSTTDDIDDVNPAYAGLLGTGRVNLLKALGDNMQRYPEEFPTLFDALNSAASGDTVGLEGGTVVNESLNLPGRGVKFFGGYSADYTSRDPVGNPTTITGNLSTSTLRFLPGVESDTEVDGFLIQGGGGIVFSGIPYFARYGGGVMLNNVSPTLRNLTLTGNSVGGSSELGCGGGIAMTGSSSLLENVTIEGNAGVLGSGFFAYNSTPTLQGCTIDANTAINDNLSNLSQGGGIHAVDSDLTLIDCTVSGHLEFNDGGGIFMGGTSSLDMSGGSITGNSAKNRGAGLYQSGGAVDLAGVLIDANVKTASATFMNGGGFWINGATAVMDSVVLTGNDAHSGGGGLFDTCLDVTFGNSVATGNTALFFGGGLTLQNNVAATVTGSTFAENAGTNAGGGGIYLSGGNAAVDHSIIAFNTGGGAANGFSAVSGTATFSCNDVFGNTTADFTGVTDPTGSNGNVSVDPLFCTAAGNFNLQSASPCHPDNSGGCGLIGALNGGCGLSDVPVGNGVVPLAFRVEPNFPNPFNPSTTIRFALPQAGHTTVTIYDIKGRHVRTLMNENLEAQVHEVKWAGRDDSERTMAAGVYFYMVTSGDNKSVGRMALVK